MRSIKFRVIFTNLIVLVGFIILTVIALERAVDKRMLLAEEDKLQALMYSILAAIDRDATGLSITVADERLFENALFNSQSGLQASIYSGENEIWRSLSSIDSYPQPEGLNAEELRFKQVDLDGKRLFQLAFSIRWPNVNNELSLYQLVIWKDAADYFGQFKRFRQTLWLWLIITVTLLFLVMWLVMLWSLRPLRLIGEEVQAIENGHKHRFDSRYPAEIKPLTQNLNLLLQREEHQMQRYRNALDDLAHSLKTPLAVIQGLSDRNVWQDDEKRTLQQQNERMNQIVSYQLQRAATVGGELIAKPVDLSALLKKTVSALTKVYRDKGVKIELLAAEAIQLRMDESDLLEVLGNLIDNACKYGRKKVLVHTVDEDDEVQLMIEDDGEGLRKSQIKKIIKRGIRFDQTREGQGIGLAVVNEIVSAYEIDMDFGCSSLGGLKVCLTFNNS
jgi:two-component system sensor histidine kinase PhoQ